MSRRILQIVAADPWWRAISSGDGPHAQGQPVACWALVEQQESDDEEPDTYVDGMIVLARSQDLMLCGDCSDIEEIVYIPEVGG